MSERDAQNREIPAHVPAELVNPFDFHSKLGSRPQEAIAGLHEGVPIFYSPIRHTFGSGGAWVVTRAADVREVMARPETFSSKIQGDFLELIGETSRLPPLDSDPPAHQRYRALIAPLFSARRMVDLEPKIRRRCIDLIADFAPDGGCEFVSMFAERFPTGVFIELMGLPGERLHDFVMWAQTFIHGETLEIRAGAAKKAIGYFRELFRSTVEEPGDSILGQLVHAEPAGSSLSEDEFAGLAFLLFNAGLDTIVASLGFIFRLLAERPDLQEKLRSDARQIPRHTEEMMRLFSPVTPQRIVTEDTEIATVEMKQGDIVALSLAAASRDPAVFKDPGEFDAARNPNPHFGFGHGIHRCIGSQLARTNIAIAIEEFLARIEDFRVAPDAKITAKGGSVLALDRLPLIWEPR